MGLVGFMLVPVLTQRSVDYIATRDFARRPLQWLSLIGRNGGDPVVQPELRLRPLHPPGRRAQRRGARSGSSWRGAGIGGDMVQPEVLRRFSETFASCNFDPRAFVPSYGLAEATLAFSFSPLGSGGAVRRDQQGRLCSIIGAAPSRFRPTDPDAPRDRALRRAPAGPRSSRCAIRVRRGYCRTARLGHVFIKGAEPDGRLLQRARDHGRAAQSQDGWLNTGDLGYTVEGALVITGRAKDLILVNGRNIWPQDLEWAVEELASRCGAATRRPSRSWKPARRTGSSLLVQCRLRDPDARAALAQARSRARCARPPGVETTVGLIPHRDLPKTSSGKLSRTRARQMYLEGAFGAQRRRTLDHGPASS